MLNLIFSGARTSDLVMHSDYPPEVCAIRLTDAMDIDERTLFSFSGYRGEKPILGRISGIQFRVHKRRYWRNDFAPVLYGRLIPEMRGTRIEAYWGMQNWTRTFMRIWIALAMLIGVPMFVAVLYQLITEPPAESKDSYVGLIVPPALILWGFILPKLGSALGFHERKYLVEFLQQSLIAGPVARVADNAEWRSSLE
jgi:hypothetical protein